MKTQKLSSAAAAPQIDANVQRTEEFQQIVLEAMPQVKCIARRIHGLGPARLAQEIPPD